VRGIGPMGTGVAVTSAVKIPGCALGLARLGRE
jgi:hypothetical protein